MSLDQLRYFVTVANLGTTRAAAQALHISQPPLSRQLKALEEEVGTPLFERTSRGMKLNPAGEVLLSHAQSILGALTRAVDATRRARGGTGAPGTALGQGDSVEGRGCRKASTNAAAT